MVADGSVHPDEHVVVYNTGAAQKYLEVIQSDLPEVSSPVDWEALLAT
jgi:threonine synthase